MAKKDKKKRLPRGRWESLWGVQWSGRAAEFGGALAASEPLPADQEAMARLEAKALVESCNAVRAAARDNAHQRLVDAVSAFSASRALAPTLMAQPPGLLMYGKVRDPMVKAALDALYDAEFRGRAAARAQRALVLMAVQGRPS